MLVAVEEGDAFRGPLRIVPWRFDTAGYTNNPAPTVNSELSYRRGLYARLTNAGDAFQLVDESGEPFNGEIPGRPDARAPTPRRSTYGPRRTVTVGTAARRRGSDGEPRRPRRWLAINRPDIVLLHIGANGPNASQLDELLTTITTAAHHR